MIMGGGAIILSYLTFQSVFRYRIVIHKKKVKLKNIVSKCD